MSGRRKPFRHLFVFVCDSRPHKGNLMLGSLGRGSLRGKAYAARLRAYWRMRVGSRAQGCRRGDCPLRGWLFAWGEGVPMGAPSFAFPASGECGGLCGALGRSPANGVVAARKGTAPRTSDRLPFKCAPGRRTSNVRRTATFGTIPACSASRRQCRKR